MNASRQGIQANETTVRWFEALMPIAVPVISVVISLYVAKAVFEEKLNGQQSQILELRSDVDKQDDRIAAIYAALADIRSGVSEIRGRLATWEVAK